MTVQTKLKNNIYTIVTLIILAILSGYSTHKVAVLSDEIKDLKDGGSIYALKTDVEDLNSRHEKLATAYYDMTSVFDDNVAIYNKEIKKINEDIGTLAGIVEKIINYYN